VKNSLDYGLYFVAFCDKIEAIVEAILAAISISKKCLWLVIKNTVFDYESEAFFGDAKCCKNHLLVCLYFVAFCDKIEAHLKAIFSL
jgi:hypothetical protein